LTYDLYASSIPLSTQGVSEGIPRQGWLFLKLRERHQMKTLTIAALFFLSTAVHASDTYYSERATFGGAATQAASGSVASVNGTGLAISGNRSSARTNITGRVNMGSVRIGGRSVTNSNSTVLSLGSGASGVAAGEAMGNSFFNRARVSIRQN